MPSKLFHAIVLAGVALGAGCRTRPQDADGGQAGDAGADAGMIVDASSDGACPCPIQCPTPDMPVCNGNCSDGCKCYPCFI